LLGRPRAAERNGLVVRCWHLSLQSRFSAAAGQAWAKSATSADAADFTNMLDEKSSGLSEFVSPPERRLEVPLD
jgi:hypothetical protein